jgi:hypothetical protein
MCDATAETPDNSLIAVRNWFSATPNLGSDIGRVLRKALDEVIDGGRTGRWAVEQLEKTEKTYIGTKVEILLKYEFDLPKGQMLDASIAGHEVDIKCTVQGGYGWMIPKEAVGHICLLIGIDDRKNRFRAGLVRCSTAILNSGSNQDGKRTISSSSRHQISWLVQDGQLPPNFLATLNSDVRSRIVDHRTGQKRINELFRRVHRRIIDRNALETVARQLDPMRRMRGARKDLLKEGILVLGHQNDDPRLARLYGVPEPKKGEAIAVQIDTLLQGQ